MHLRLEVHGDPAGTWSVKGLPQQSARFANLSDCLEHAKQECAAAPAVIEFFSDGEYVVSVRQEKGWPRQLPQPGGRRPIRSQRAAIPARASKLSQLGDVLTRLASVLGVWGAWSRGAWVTLQGASSGSTFRVPPASRGLKVSARK